MAVDARPRARRQTTAAVALLLIGAVLLVALGEARVVRLDLTADRRHTLAPVTRGLLAEADGTIEVRAFLPRRIQPPYRRAVRALADTLDAMRVEAGGRLRLVVHDPTAELDADARAALDEAAEGYGIPAVQTQVTEGDVLVQDRVRFGVAFLLADRQATVAPVERAEDAEYVLTRALRAVVRHERRRPIIGVTAGHGEPELADSPVATLMQPIGDVQRVVLDGRPLPANLDALLILGPRQPFGDRDRYVIDQFLMRGRAVVALLDYRPPSTVFPQVLVPLKTGLEPLLSHYGVEIDPERTAIDRTQALPAPVGRDANGRVITVNHPLFVRLRDLDPTHPATRGLGSLAGPLAAPITVDRARQNGLQATLLARTGPEAGVRTGVSTLEPATYSAPSDDPAVESAGSVAVAAAIRGTFGSYFVDRQRPPPPGVGAGLATPTPEPPFTDRSRAEARLLVMTSGTRMLAAGENALVFLQNAVEWAVTDGALSALRARAAVDPPLEPTTATARGWIKVGMVLGPSGLLLLFAGLRRLRRRGAR